MWDSVRNYSVYTLSGHGNGGKNYRWWAVSLWAAGERGWRVEEGQLWGQSNVGGFQKGPTVPRTRTTCLFVFYSLRGATSFILTVREINRAKPQESPKGRARWPCITAASLLHCEYLEAPFSTTTTPKKRKKKCTCVRAKRLHEKSIILSAAWNGSASLFVSERQPLHPPELQIHKVRRGKRKMTALVLEMLHVGLKILGMRGSEWFGTFSRRGGAQDWLDTVLYITWRMERKKKHVVFGLFLFFKLQSHLCSVAHRGATVVHSLQKLHTPPGRQRPKSVNSWPTWEEGGGSKAWKHTRRSYSMLCSHLYIIQLELKDNQREAGTQRLRWLKSHLRVSQCPRKSGATFRRSRTLREGLNYHQQQQLCNGGGWEPRLTEQLNFHHLW